ncbi:MAG: hypothetical protein HYR96_04930 [Deltaproteobacteria bacterium]|nr:hypothetical protein [Deltaproteobacteria bacterium]MBI3294568.1 hypothetical protein [Deltaproteobacteria bacterium]
MNRLLLAFLFIPVLSIAKPSHATTAPKAATGTHTEAGKDEVTKMVDEEYNKETTNVKAEWERVNKKIAELSNHRDKAVADSKARGQWEAQGAELLQKFQTVITARYHTSTGEFDGGIELTTRDQDNVNKVFNRYLQALPLKGHVSAGEAVRFLEWGNKRLVGLSRTHMDPNEGNNSELEILAAQMRGAEAEQTRLTGMAKIVGVDFPGAGTATAKPKTAPTVKFLSERSAPPPGAGLLPPVQSAEAPSDNEEANDSKALIRAPSSNTKKKAGAKNLLPDF